jgi:hypothetical protein
MAAGLASAAPGAKPSVALSVRATPVSRSVTIPEEGDIPRTGNIAGAGADLEASLTIGGTEHLGSPPPLTEVHLQLPPGLVWDPHGFAACNPEDRPPLVSERYPRCPQATLAGRAGSASAAVAFGSSFVPEALSVRSNYALEGGLDLIPLGHTPVLVEAFITGRIARSGSARRLDLSVPLIETVPGGGYTSLTKLAFHAGSALGMKGHRRFSLRMPRRCPHGVLRFKVEVAFAAVSGVPRQTASAEYRAPCPRRLSAPPVYRKLLRGGVVDHSAAPAKR